MLINSDLTLFYECEMSCLSDKGVKNYSDYSIFEPKLFH